MQHTQQIPFHLSPAVSRELTPSPTLYINERVNEMWAAGQTVYHLGFGESRFPVHPKIQEALRANVHQKSYLAGQGLAGLRSAAAAAYSRAMDREIDSSQVIIGPGSKSIIYRAADGARCRPHSAHAKLGELRAPGQSAG